LHQFNNKLKGLVRIHKLFEETVEGLCDYFELYEVPAYFEDDRQMVLKLFRDVKKEVRMSEVGFKRFTQELMRVVKLLRGRYTILAKKLKVTHLEY
jgi:hypothetical protein